MSEVKLTKDLELVYDDENNQITVSIINQLPVLIWKISDDNSVKFNVTNVQENGRIKPGIMSKNYKKIFKLAEIRHNRTSELFNWCIKELNVTHVFKKEIN